MDDGLSTTHTTRLCGPNYSTEEQPTQIDFGGDGTKNLQHGIFYLARLRTVFFLQSHVQFSFFSSHQQQKKVGEGEVSHTHCTACSSCHFFPNQHPEFAAQHGTRRFFFSRSSFHLSHFLFISVRFPRRARSRGTEPDFGSSNELVTKKGGKRKRLFEPSLETGRGCFRAAGVWTELPARETRRRNASRRCWSGSGPRRFDGYEG